MAHTSFHGRTKLEDQRSEAGARRREGWRCGTMMMEFATTGIGRIAAEAGAEFAVFDMEHTGWSMETIRMLMATSRRPTWCRWSGSRRSSTTSSPGCSMSVRWGSSCRWSGRRSGADARGIGEVSARRPPRRWPSAIAHDDYRLGDLADGMQPGQPGGHRHRPDRDGRRRRGSRRIAAVDGIDALWIGQYDLTASLGIPGRFDHPDFHQATRPRPGRLSTSMARPPCSAPATSRPSAGGPAEGFRMLVYLADVWIYQQALRQGLSAVSGS